MTDEPPVSVLRDGKWLLALGHVCVLCVSRYLDTSPVSSTLLFSLLRARPIADKSCRQQQHLKHISNTKSVFLGLAVMLKLLGPMMAEVMTKRGS